ncbi:ABC transporter ATP-binding protein [Kaustia mangrovi]|uniref:ABC transporter ATP-binding protein n=1 Tax=Kaustia mangrovi TaxID=2593653 RepID=A0A7S8HD96_9HYPH|nr:ABC transporter ATP-binding protein [Kaustia mangrovi]QPC44249.1 ABC transporter ATP-binding protein [Kaustia mangrovi]
MGKIFRIFFTAEGTQPLFVLLCLLLAGLAEAVSLGALLPTITEIGGGQKDSSALSTYVTAALDTVGIAHTLPNLILIVSGALIAKAVLSFAALSYAGAAVARVSTHLRTKLLDQLMSVRWRYFANQRVGRIANAISGQAARAGQAYFMAAKFMSFVVQAFIYAVISFLISPALAAAGLAVGAFLSLSMSALVRLSRRAGYRQTDRTSELVSYVSDAFNNIKPLKSMNRQAPFSALFETKIRKLRKALKNQVLAKQGLIYGREVLLAVILGLSVYLAADVWNVPLAELVVLGIVFFQMVSITGKMQQHLQRAVELESAYWRIQGLIEDTAAEREPDDGTRMPTLTEGCTFRNVSFAHQKTPVVHSVDLEVPAGEITVLQGSSGAGKTTIIDLLIGLYEPDEGEVLIDGVPLKEISLKAWRQMIGYVPQELTLLHGTVYENVTLGDVSISREKAREALAKADALSFVDSLPEGIDTTVGEQGTKLSGGQRQRIAIARALVGDPQLLVLDEVTSALDPETEAEICRNIQALGGEYTIVAITHRPAWTTIATRLYKVSHGHATKAEPAPALPQTA